jgi:hypothetical protein
MFIEKVDFRMNQGEQWVEILTNILENHLQEARQITAMESGKPPDGRSLPP